MLKLVSLLFPMSCNCQVSLEWIGMQETLRDIPEKRWRERWKLRACPNQLCWISFTSRWKLPGPPDSPRTWWNGSDSLRNFILPSRMPAVIQVSPVDLALLLFQQPAASPAQEELSLFCRGRAPSLTLAMDSVLQQFFCIRSWCLPPSLRPLADLPLLALPLPRVQQISPLLFRVTQLSLPWFRISSLD